MKNILRSFLLFFTFCYFAEGVYGQCASGSAGSVGCNEVTNGTSRGAITPTTTLQSVAITNSPNTGYFEFTNVLAGTLEYRYTNKNKSVHSELNDTRRLFANQLSNG